MGKFGLSQPVRRTEDPKFLKGHGRYVDDIVLPGLTHACVVRSPHAHARINKIDTTAAKNAPGVLLVLTLADYKEAGLGALPSIIPGVPNFGPDKVYAPDRYPLTSDVARFVGDGIAFVVAETLSQARDAAELVAVDYEPLPVIASTRDATRPGSAQVWPDCPENISYRYELGNGTDTDAAFTKADKIAMEEFLISRVSANSLEARGLLADYDARADFHTIYASNQSAFGLRTQLAKVIFKDSPAKFRVIVNDVGGSFGMKGSFYPEYALTAWASRLLGRPVKWMSDRSEAHISDNHGRDNITKAELALDSDGNFLAIRVNTTANLGAYLATMGSGPPVMHISGLVGVYTIPAAHISVTGAFTNTNPTAAYRGAGRPEAAYIIERIVDKAAIITGLDPAEIRRRNLIPASAIPYQTALTFNFDSGDFSATFEQGLAASDYDGFEARRKQSEENGKMRGIGIAYTIARAGPPGFEFTELRVESSGSITVYAGTTNHGQGHQTMYTQMVCETLGLTPDDVQVVDGDTGRVKNGSGTGGSRVSALGSSAVLIAANKIISKGKAIASHILEAAKTDIEFSEGIFAVAGTDKSLTFKDIAKAAYAHDKLPPGMDQGLNETGTHKAAVANYPNGCHVCEVEIDPVTGKVELVKYTVVDDCGIVINPLLLKGQILGGIAQGAGQILFEQITHDPDSGQLLTGSFMDYAMPKAQHFCPMEIVNNIVPTNTNPLGVKGGGEAGTVGSMPCVMNAIVNALLPLGVTNLDMPATPERIWWAIKNSKITGG